MIYPENSYYGNIVSNILLDDKFFINMRNKYPLFAIQ